MHPQLYSRTRPVAITQPFHWFVSFISVFQIGAPAPLLPFFQQRPLVTGRSSRATVCRFSPGLLALLLYSSSWTTAAATAAATATESCWTSHHSCPPTPTDSCRVLLSGDGHDTRPQQTHNTVALARIMVQFVARHQHSWLMCVEEPWRGSKELPPFVLCCWWPADPLVSVSSTNTTWNQSIHPE